MPSGFRRLGDAEAEDPEAPEGAKEPAAKLGPGGPKLQLDAAKLHDVVGHGDDGPQPADPEARTRALSE